MNIKKYGVVIDDVNYGCGVIVDPSEYSIEFLNTNFLYYSVNHETKTIDVFSKTKDVKISFLNINHELMYHAFKTDVFVIFVGDRFCKNPPSTCYEAILA